MTFSVRTDENVAVRLLTEAFHAVSGCKCRAGAFYRLAKGGLAQRIRECLEGAGIKIADPPHRPASNSIPSSTPAGRVALHLVQPGPALSCGDEDEFTCEAEPGRGFQEEQ